MGWVAGVLLVAGTQDPIEMQVEAILRQYETAALSEQAGARLAEQLMALGGSAAEPLARRLAEDLRDGMASAFAGAIVEALLGRPEAQMPLQTAFADGATSSAGRIELARALSDLADQVSWREGLLAIAEDPEVGLEDRRRAAELLLEAGDGRALEILSEIEDLGGASLLSEMREVEERPRRWREEPRMTVVADMRPASAGEPRRLPLKKREEGDVTAYAVILGAAAAGAVALLLVYRRKG